LAAALTVRPAPPPIRHPAARAANGATRAANSR